MQTGWTFLNNTQMIWIHEIFIAQICWASWIRFMAQVLFKIHNIHWIVLTMKNSCIQIIWATYIEFVRPYKVQGMHVVQIVCREKWKGKKFTSIHTHTHTQVTIRLFAACQCHQIAYRCFNGLGKPVWCRITFWSSVSPPPLIVCEFDIFYLATQRISALAAVCS